MIITYKFYNVFPGGNITRYCGKVLEDDDCDTNDDNVETCYCKTNYCNGARLAIGSASPLVVTFAVSSILQH